MGRARLVRRLSRIVLLWLGVFGSGTATSEPAASLRELHLQVGDSDELLLPSSADIQVSRRGILDLFHVGKGRWQITALRAGIVLVAASHDDTATRFLVRVTNPDDPDGSPSPAYMAAPLPAWICATAGLACRHDQRIVTGLVGDAALYLQAAAVCAHRATCLFQARLSPTAQERLTADLQRLAGPDYLVGVSPAGVLQAHATCDPTSRDERKRSLVTRVRGAIPEERIDFTCDDDQAPVTYQLETRIFRTGESTAETLGFAGDPTLSLQAVPWRVDAQLASKLEAATVSRRVEVIGEPTLRLVSGRKAEARSGGEFQVALHDPLPGEARAAWKPFGLHLAATAHAATPTRADHARLTYELSLSARDGGTSESLSVHSVKGDLDLPLDTPVVAAVLDLRSSDDEKSARPFLAQIPIIGPLFRLTTTGEQRSRVYATFKLARDGDERSKAALRGP